MRKAQVILHDEGGGGAEMLHEETSEILSSSLCIEIKRVPSLRFAKL